MQVEDEGENHEEHQGDRGAVKAVVGLLGMGVGLVCGLCLSVWLSVSRRLCRLVHVHGRNSQVPKSGVTASFFHSTPITIISYYFFLFHIFILFLFHPPLTSRLRNLRLPRGATATGLPNCEQG